MYIAILTGGISSEREVALRSGTNMKEWCLIAGHEVDLFDLPSELSRFLEIYTIYDLVIPVFHGIYGEDGQISAFLATLGCRYAYSPPDTHSLCIDKYRTQAIVEKIGISTPETIYVREGEDFDATTLTYPRFIKPNRGGSSISNFLVKNSEEYKHALSSIAGDAALIQRLIPGREYTVGVYHYREGTHVLPIIETIAKNSEFFDYAEKYLSDGSNEIFVDLEPNLKGEIEKMSQKIYDFLGCRGVVRIDYRYDGKTLYFLEVNTIPGFTSGSLIPKMWKKALKTEREFVEMLLC